MSDHKLAKKEAALHTTVANASDNGACLAMHEGCSTYDPNSCSYRWQSKENARERHKKFFDDPSERLAKNKQGGDAPAAHWRIWYAGPNDTWPKDPDDWKVDGPSRPPTDPRKDSRGFTIQNGKNYTNARWPFWNNAHHMIPKGTFGRLINQTGKAYQLLRVCLLEAKYNIHWKRNMFILPMDVSVAAELMLPRHLGLIKPSDRFNHPDYNDVVESRLKAVIDDYKRTCDQAVGEAKPHELPKAKLSKAKLEHLSKVCELMIKSFGAVALGGALDEMKQSPPPVVNP